MAWMMIRSNHRDSLSLWLYLKEQISGTMIMMITFENDSQCEWDDDVDDTIWEQDCRETFDEQQDVIIEDENNDDV
jgi:hypothetical protein